MGAKLAKVKKQKELNRERQRRYRERQKAAQAAPQLLDDIGDDDPIVITEPVTGAVTSDEVARVLLKYRWIFEKHGPPQVILDTLLALVSQLLSNNPTMKAKAYHEIGVGFGIIAPPQPVAAVPAAEELPEEPPPMLASTPPQNPILNVLMGH